MVHPILVDSNEPALELARRSYLGGRVECGRLGRVDGPVYRLDVNSMYPAVMRDNWYPTRLIGHTSRAEVAELHEWLAKWCVVAEVDLATDEPAYPVVVEGRLVFPVGRFLTVLASPELQHALERERVLAVHAVACYDRAVLFKAFVEECWAIRLAAIQAGDSVTQWATGPITRPGRGSKLMSTQAGYTSTARSAGSTRYGTTSRSRVIRARPSRRT